MIYLHVWCMPAVIAAFGGLITCTVSTVSGDLAVLSIVGASRWRGCTRKYAALHLQQL